MKPFYYKNDILAIVYKSVHEEDDYIVLIREEKYMNHFHRVCEKDPKSAADFAVSNFLKLQSAKRDLSL